MRPHAIHKSFVHLFHPRQSATSAHPAPDELVRRTRSALRARNAALAEALLGECGDAVETDPDCLNLRGLLAELRGEWQQARRYWVRAARHDPPSRAASQNLRRYFELYQFGRTWQAVALGDEPDTEAASTRTPDDH